jgi:hypothetical protein
MRDLYSIHLKRPRTKKVSAQSYPLVLPHKIGQHQSILKIPENSMELSWNPQGSELRPLITGLSIEALTKR